MEASTIIVIVYWVGFFTSIVLMFMYFGKYRIEEGLSFEIVMIVLLSLIWPATLLAFGLELFLVKKAKTRRQKHSYRRIGLCTRLT